MQFPLNDSLNTYFDSNPKRIRGLRRRTWHFYLSDVKNVFIYMILVSIFMLWLRRVMRMKQITHLTYFNAELHTFSRTLTLGCRPSDRTRVLISVYAFLNGLANSIFMYNKTRWWHVFLSVYGCHKQSANINRDSIFFSIILGRLWDVLCQK
jgi:hypothetical protein